MDLQLQGGQNLDSAVEHIQMEEEMMIPKNILNTTFKLVLVFPCKTDQPQRISSTTGLAALLLEELFSCCVKLTHCTLPGCLKFQYRGKREVWAPHNMVIYSNLSVLKIVQLHNYASENTT